MLKVRRAEPRPYVRLVLGGEPSVGKTKAAYEWSKRLTPDSKTPPALWIDLDERIPEEIINGFLVFATASTKGLFVIKPEEIFIIGKFNF